MTRADAAAELSITPLSPALGAEIGGVDLANIDDETFVQLYAAWLEHQVLLIRDQSLSDADLVAFSRRFGPLDIAPPNENGVCSVEGLPEILIISNVKENGVAIGSLGDGESIWHSDMNYLARPPVGSILYCWETPEAQGRTGFLNTALAYEALDAETRQRIEGLTIKHDSSTNSAGYLRAGAEDVEDVTRSPGTVHPIVRVHPETGRRTLFLGRRRFAHVPGLSLEESEALLDHLWSVATRPEFTWHHSWRPGDALIWDNRSTMHRRDAFDPGSRRIMHRTQLGARPGEAFSLGL